LTALASAITQLWMRASKFTSLYANADGPHDAASRDGLSPSAVTSYDQLYTKYDVSIFTHY